MTLALRVSVWLSLALVVPAAAFLIRTFIVFHDCTHGSFMRSRRANDALGVVLGLARLAAVPRLAARARRPSCDGRRPRPAWRRRRRHADGRRVPGASRRGGRSSTGSTATRSSCSASAGSSCSMLKPRFVPRGARRRVRNSVLATNLVLALIVAAALPDDRLARLPARARARVPRQRRSRSLAVLRAAPVRRHLLAGARRLALRPRRARGKLVPEAARRAAVLHRQHRLPPRASPERRDPELQPASRAPGNRPSPGGAANSRCSKGCARQAEAVGRAARPTRHVPRGTGRANHCVTCGASGQAHRQPTTWGRVVHPSSLGGCGRSRTSRRSTRRRASSR